MHSLARHATCPQPAAGPYPVASWTGLGPLAQQDRPWLWPAPNPLLAGNKSSSPRGGKQPGLTARLPKWQPTQPPTPKAAGTPGRELSGQELNSFLLPERGGGSRLIPMM